MNFSIEWITESFSQSFHSEGNETPLYVAVALCFNAKIEKIYNIDKTVPKSNLILTCLYLGETALCDIA